MARTRPLSRFLGWLIFLAASAPGARASLFPEPASASPAAPTEELRRLDRASPVEASLGGGRAHVYVIELERGQYLQIAVEQKGIDVALRLFAPDGKPLAETDSLSGAYSLEEISLIAEVSGPHRLEVRSAAKEAGEGRYLLRIAQLREAVAQDPQHILAERAYSEGVRLYREGTAESQRKAIARYREALSSWESLGDQFHQANALSDLGDVHQSLSDNQKALEAYLRALALRRENGDRRGEAEALNNIGGVYQGLGENAKALEYFQQALPLAKSVGDRTVEAIILFNLASVSTVRGERQTALDYYKESLPISHQTGDRMSEMKTLVGMGVLAAALNQNQEALDYYNQVLPIVRAQGDIRGEGVVLNNIALVYDVLGEKQKALDLLNQALPLHQAAGNRRTEASTLSHIGGVYDGLGEKQKALEYFGRALPIRRALGDRRGEATTLNRQGMVYSSLGDQTKAIECYEQALRLRRAIGDAEEAFTLSNIGLAHARLGETEKALEEYQQALAIHRTVGDRYGEAVALARFARAQADLGKLSEARQTALKALTGIESLRSTILSQELRATYFASLQEAFDFSISLTMRLHRLEPNAGFAADALETSERARARSLLELLTEARARIREGVDPQLLERERSLQQRLAAQYESRIKLLSGTHTQEEAAKASREIQALTIESEQLEAQMRSTSPRYAALTQPRPLPLSEIQREVVGDPDTLLLEYALGKEKSFLWAVTSSSLASYELPGREELEPAARNVYELLTARNRRVKFETSGQRQRRIRRADAEYSRQALALGRTLLAPVAALLQKKRLLIVSDGALQYLSFAALPEPGLGAEPLITRHEIIHLPSASTLAVLRSELSGRPLPEKTIAVLADPVFDRADARVSIDGPRRARLGNAPSATEAASDSELVRSARDAGLTEEGRLRIPRLPFTRQEARAILALSRPEQRKEALDFDANRATAVDPALGQYRFVHFATHAWLDTAHPDLSGIVLSLVDRQGKEQDGFLSASQIFNLRLPVDLVTLSGCRTGLGKEFKGEGLVGLSRAFMYAGAARVLVSLWDVNDQATADLMSRFYRGMLGTEKLRPAAALRKAQIAMARGKEKSAPYYWAGFILQGEPR